MLTEPVKITLTDGSEREFRPRLGALMRLERKFGSNAFEQKKFEATAYFLYECQVEKKAGESLDDFADLVSLDAVGEIMSHLNGIKSDTDRPFGPKLVN